MSFTYSPFVSILIITLRGGENLKKCLLSVKKNNYKHYELVVVNNGGPARISHEVREIYPKAKIVNLKRNTGFAEGNNIGYKSCHGRYILFLNDDTITTPDFLKILVENAEKQKEIAVFQPKTIFASGALQAGADYFTPTGFLYHYGYGTDPDNPIFNLPLFMYSANGNCMLVRKKVIEKVGLFDDDFYAYLEETDFCHRVWLAGYKVGYFPESVVFHKGGETSKHLDRSIWLFHPHKNRLCTYLKNLNVVNLIKVLPVQFILYQIIFLSYLIKQNFSAALYIQKAIWWNITNLPLILRKRRLIQKKIRKIDDRKFMEIVSYSAPISYYYSLFVSGFNHYKYNSLTDSKKIESESAEVINYNSSVLAATFSPWIKGQRMPTNGSVEPLINFFPPRIKKLILIDQPYPGSDFLSPRIELYENGKLKKISSSSNWINIILYPFLKLADKPGTHLSFKLRDFISVIDCCIRSKIHFDYFIGLESINTVAGIIMRKFGFIGKVIYYVSDYSPRRYPNKIINWFYIQLDRFCATHSDFIWDVSRAIQPARIEAGLNPRKSAPVIHVPNALNPEQIKYNSTNCINPFSLVYMGTLGPENGLDIMIKALPEVLQKFPKTTLQIIGGGEYDKKRLEHLVSELKIGRNVKFYGFIPDGEKMSKKLRECYVGLSTYRAIAGSPRYYGDAGKIRAYAGAGLPIITTNVPPLGREVAEKNAAIIAGDNPNDFARSINRIFSDRKLYLRLRRNSIRFAEKNTWENSFIYALRKMKKYEKKV